MSRPLILGLLRVRDAEPYLPKLIPHLKKVCDKALVVDDGSTDRTFRILSEDPFFQVKQNTDGVHHGGRDWIALWKWARDFNPLWVYSPDADELVVPGDEDLIRPLVESSLDPFILAYSFPFFNLWDSEDLYRTDLHYGKMEVIRLMRYDPMQLPEDRPSHAQALPATYDRRRVYVMPLKTVHYGYMTQAQREAKYKYYCDRDPDALAAGSGGTSYDHMLAKPELAPWREAKCKHVIYDLALLPLSKYTHLVELKGDLEKVPSEEQGTWIKNLFDKMSSGSWVMVRSKDWDALAQAWLSSKEASLEDQASLTKDLKADGEISCLNMHRLNTLLYFAGFREIQRIPAAVHACELNVLAFRP